MSKWVAELTLLLIAVVWGGTFPVTKSLVEGVPANFLLAWRFGLAFVAMIPFVWRRLSLKSRKTDPKSHRSTIVSGIVLGIILWGAYALQTWGLQYTSASKAGFITGLSVIMVPPMAALILRRLPGISATVGAIFATIGMGLLSVDFSAAYYIQTGDALILGCAFLYALQIILIDKFTAKVDSLALAWVEIGTVAVLAWVYSLFEPSPNLTIGFWFGLIYLALMATAFAQTAQVVVQRYTSPTRVALFLSLEPVFAAVFATAFLGELLIWYQWIGGTLVLAGILIAELNPWRRRSLGRNSI